MWCPRVVSPVHEYYSWGAKDLSRHCILKQTLSITFQLHISLSHIPKPPRNVSRCRLCKHDITGKFSSFLQSSFLRAMFYLRGSGALFWRIAASVLTTKADKGTFVAASIRMHNWNKGPCMYVEVPISSLVAISFVCASPSQTIINDSPAKECCFGPLCFNVLLCV
jgi:hypothetical protein